MFASWWQHLHAVQTCMTRTYGTTGPSFQYRMDQAHCPGPTAGSHTIEHTRTTNKCTQSPTRVIHLLVCSQVGHLNDPITLSAVVLAGSFYNVTGFSIIVGLSAGSDTLSGQVRPWQRLMNHRVTVQCTALPTTVLHCNCVGSYVPDTCLHY